MWLSKERLLSNSTPRFLTDDEEFTEQPYSFPVAQMVEHGASNAKIMGSIPRESKS